MQLREDHSEACVQGREGFVGVHIGAGQHSEVRGDFSQVHRNGLYSFLAFTKLTRYD